MNAKGAEKVTAYFEHFLKEDFDLPDRRGDSTYASWQQSAEYWKTEHGKMLAEIASRRGVSRRRTRKPSDVRQSLSGGGK